jgi:acyl-CoA dehydrogenase
MRFDLPLVDEHRMLLDLVDRFVADELMPLEPAILAREAKGEEAKCTRDEIERLDARVSELGLWGLDAPEEMGGSDLPQTALVGVNIALGRTVVPYVFPPDTPNLRMLAATASPAQRDRYLAPYVRGETVSAIAISEPGAGSDPSAMTTRAVRLADGGWRLDGRKIWISRADTADFAIVMAVTDREAGRKQGMSAFLVDSDVPGVSIVGRIPMIGGTTTFEVAYDDVRLPASALLGTEGAGFAPMQTRLAARRLEVAAWSIGAAERALELMIAQARDRRTFGQPLAERQSVQWWIADAVARIHAVKLLAYDIARRIDTGDDVRVLVSAAKVAGPELAAEVIDHAMQTFGAMGMAKEMPLHLLAAQVRLMRIYDGPSEVHRWVVARAALAG